MLSNPITFGRCSRCSTADWLNVQSGGLCDLCMERDSALFGLANLAILVGFVAMMVLR